MLYQNYKIIIIYVLCTASSNLSIILRRPPQSQEIVKYLKLKSDYVNKVGTLISRILSEHNIFLSTLKISTQSNEELDHWLNTLGQLSPFISVEVKSRPTGKPITVVALILQDTITSQIQQTNYIEPWLKSFFNIQNDHFIFIGGKSAVQEVFKVHQINQLRFRWGFALDSEEFFYRIEGEPSKPGILDEVSKIVRGNEIASNIRGRHLKVAGWAHVPPYHFIQEVDKNGNTVYDGSNVRLFQQSSHFFNYTFELYSEDEATSYGVLLENGSWTGMVGAVYNGGYDVCLYLGPALIWHSMFDFAGSLSDAAIRFLTEQPISEIKWQAFLHPFQISLWISLLILFLIVLFIILMLLRWSQFNSSVMPSKSLCLVESTLLTYKIALEQTVNIPSGVKIICGAWLIFSIIMGTAYKSQVMSSLTFPFTERPPSTFRELAQNKKYKSNLNNIGGLEVSYFQSNDSQLIHEIAKTMSYQPIPINCIAKAVLNPKSVCIGWFPFLQYVVAEYASPDTKVMPIYLTGDPVMPTTVSFAFKKHSPYTQGFTPIINSFWESGIYSFWESDVLHIHKNKGLENYKSDPNTILNIQLKSIIDAIGESNGEKPLQMSNLKFSFGVLVFGACFGVTVFVTELISYFTSVRDVNISSIKTQIISVRSILS